MRPLNRKRSLKLTICIYTSASFQSCQTCDVCLYTFSHMLSFSFIYNYISIMKWFKNMLIESAMNHFFVKDGWLECLDSLVSYCTRYCNLHITTFMAQLLVTLLSRSHTKLCKLTMFVSKTSNSKIIFNPNQCQCIYPWFNETKESWFVTDGLPNDRKSFGLAWRTFNCHYHAGKLLDRQIFYFLVFNLFLFFFISNLNWVSWSPSIEWCLIKTVNENISEYIYI